MAAQHATPERVRELLSYCPETGRLTWRVRAGRVSAGDPVRAIRRDGYLSVRIDGLPNMAHRVAWVHFYGHWPSHTLDHINGDKTDNRIANLRDVPHALNMHNQRAAAGHNKGSSMLGAHWHKKDQRWRSNITVGGITRHLGYFDTEQQAHEAYIAAKRQLHPGCTI